MCIATFIVQHCTANLVLERFGCCCRPFTSDETRRRRVVPETSEELDVMYYKCIKVLWVGSLINLQNDFLQVSTMTMLIQLTYKFHITHVQTVHNTNKSQLMQNRKSGLDITILFDSEEHKTTALRISWYSVHVWEGYFQCLTG